MVKMWEIVKATLFGFLSLLLCIISYSDKSYFNLNVFLHYAWAISCFVTSHHSCCFETLSDYSFCHHYRSHHVDMSSANPVWLILVLAWDKTLALRVQSHLLLISPPAKMARSRVQKQPLKDSDHQVFWIEFSSMIFRQVQK